MLMMTASGSCRVAMRQMPESSLWIMTMKMITVTAISSSIGVTMPVIIIISSMLRGKMTWLIFRHV